MSLWNRAHTLAGTSAALLLASAVLPAAAQSNARAPLAIESARVTISGTSNVQASSPSEDDAQGLCHA